MSEIKAQFFVVYLNNDCVDESKKLRQVFMKEEFENTFVMSCKWRSVSANRAHFQFDVKVDEKSYEIDFYCLNGSLDSLKSTEFESTEGNHRAISMEHIKGIVVVGNMDDTKEHKYKAIREEVKKRIPLYRTSKELGAKDNNFIVVIQNNVENFDKEKVIKKVKYHKEWDSTKTLCASNSTELLQGILKML